MKTISSEQLQFWKRYREDCVDFVVNCIGTEPTWQQLQIFEAIHEPHARIALRSGHGCHAKGTLIQMHDGTIQPVECVKVGDVLMGKDSAAREVLSLAQGQEEMFLVQLVRGESFVVNGSHKLVLHYCGKSRLNNTDPSKTEVMTVWDFLKKPKWKRRRYTVLKQGYEIPDRKIPLSPYLLGILLGDGCLSQSASISIYDREILLWLSDHVTGLGLSLNSSDIGKNSAPTYRISSGNETRKKNIVLEILESLGLRGCLSGNKFIPEIYFQCSRRQRLDLLAGLIDTDGSPDKAGYEIISKSEKLARGIHRLARSLGFNSSLNTKTINKGDYAGNTYYRVRVYGDVHSIPVKVVRKRASIREINKNPLREGIKDVTSVGLGDYYGFELDGDHLYLDGNGILHHNTGKTYSTAAILLWWIVCRPFSRAIVTAANMETVNRVTWAELSRLFNAFKELAPEIGEQFELTKTQFFHKSFAQEWFAIARTAPKDNPQGLAGQHAKDLLYIVEEASAVTEEVFEVIDGALTSGENNKLIMIGNPTDNKGRFFEAFHHRSNTHTCLHWDGEKSPIVAKEMIDRFREEYGETSREYAVRVRGNFPEKVSGMLINRPQIESCIMVDVQHDEPPSIVISADIAGSGRDSTVIIVAEVSAEDQNRKVVILEMKEYRDGQSLMQTANEIAFLYRTYGECSVIVDSIGVGQGCSDKLTELGVPHKRLMWGQPSWFKDRFLNERAQGYWFLRECIVRNNISLPRENRLIHQLQNLPYDYSENGKLRMMSKERMATKNIKSPDIADAIAQLFLAELSGGAIAPVQAKETEQTIEDVIANIEF